MGSADAKLRKRLFELFSSVDDSSEMVGSSPEEPPPPPAPHTPPALPLEVLPNGLQAWAKTLADAMVVSTDYVTAAVLGTAAGALGGTFRLEIEPGWVEAPRLWMALVGSPGAGKSPVLKRVAEPLWAAHERAVRKYEAEFQQYERVLVEWNKERAQWRKSGQGTELPPRPQPPAQRWLVVTDTTREALVRVLQDNPPGVLVFADELAGLVRDWTRYKDSGGRQAWLSLWTGSPLHVERKSHGHAFLAQPFVVLLGGIQPRVVRAVAPLDRDDGLLSRFLFAYPDPPPVPAVFPPSPDDTLWRMTVNRLLAVRESERVLKLTPEAAASFAELRRWAMTEAREPGDDQLAAILAKLPSQAARLALVLTGLEAACVGIPLEQVYQVGEAAVMGAWALVRVFAEHAARVLGEARMSAEDRQAAALLKWLERRGGQATPRDVARAKVAGITRTSDAEAPLRDLANRGYGRLEQHKRSWMFRLMQPSSEAVDNVAEGRFHRVAHPTQDRVTRVLADWRANVG